MANFIAFDSVGNAIAVIPADSPEQAIDLVLQNSELSDAVKIIPEEETWAYKSANQKAEMDANIQQAVQGQHQQDLASEPWWKKTARGAATLAFPNAMASANAGMPEQNIQGALVYGDVPMYAGMATGNPGLAMIGSITGNTAGQMVGRGEYDAGEGAINSGLASIPVVGGSVANAVGRGLQAIAPKVAYYAVKPTMKMMGNPNPPNFEKMLREGVFPYFGGLKSSYESLVKKITPLRDRLHNAIREGDQAGASLNIEQIKKSAFDQLESDKQLKFTEKNKIKDALNQELDAYYGEYTTVNPESGVFTTEIPLSEGYPKKQGLQTSAFEKFSSSDFGGARADKILSRAMNSEIGSNAPAVRMAAKDVAPYESMLSAMQRRLGIPAQNNAGLGLYDYQAMQAAAQLTGGNKLAQLGSLGAKNLLSSTGGAQMLFDAGGNLLTPRPGLGLLSLSAANQAPSLDFLMGKIFGENN